MLVCDQDRLQCRNVSYIAELCCVCEETVRRWIRSGKLRATKTSRRSGFQTSVLDLKIFLSTHPKYHEAAANYIVKAIMERNTVNEK